MESRNQKIMKLLSLIRKCEEHFLIHFIRDGDDITILSKKSIETDEDLWIEHLSNGVAPVNSEDEIQF